ncbi:MAG: hypothetical protein DWH87_02855 [Planctomycetota bacterium]|nr:MAG: hypothetical protein DWH87_02855 [Planctomycetota bacterium]
MDRMTVWMPRRLWAVARVARAGGAAGCRLAVCLALSVVLGGSAVAQGPSRPRPAPPRPPSFGAESKEAEAPPPLLSREELLRRFDLNFDGKIDEAEGELGRAKLRREREEEERQRRDREEINPLTGRPRGEDGLKKEAEPRKRRIISIDDLLPGNEDSSPDSLPGDEAGERMSGAGRGTASRQEKSESIDPAAPGRSRSGGLLGSKEAPRSAARKSSATPEALNARPGILSGGVRAGAPPARPGYGAPSTTPGGGSKSSRPLNAGRPVGSLRPGSSPAKPGAPAVGNGAGGQLPARPQTGRSAATLPTESAPRVPLFPDRPIE